MERYTYIDINPRDIYTRSNVDGTAESRALVRIDIRYNPVRSSSASQQREEQDDPGSETGETKGSRKVSPYVTSRDEFRRRAANP